MVVINEGFIKLDLKIPSKISKEMSVFYNPVMSLNRDISILLLNSIDQSNLQIADPLAASGVRSIRFLKELNRKKIKNISINDHNREAINSIKNSLTLNKIQYKNNQKIKIYNEDADLFLLNSHGFDYIDLDPYGNPSPFLDSACKRISRVGILAVTATDTSALCGSFPKVCLRKYWAMPKKDAMMHETGLRILIRKIQLMAAQYDKALTPIFSYSKAHYMRTFLRSEKGKNKVDPILELHGLFNETGSMWLGSLWDKKLVDKMYLSALNTKIFKENNELITFLKTIMQESRINAVGFYDLHSICEKYKIKNILKKDIVKKRIIKFGHKVSDTHFCGNGIRSDIPMNKLIRMLENK